MTRGLARRPGVGRTASGPSGPRAAAAGLRPPLLVACALGVERLALGRIATQGGDPAEVTVLRTGMGPEAACRALARALRGEPVAGGTAVAVTGFCAGLLPGMHPGDLVLADETRDESRDESRDEACDEAHGETRAGAARTACTGNAQLARALAALGTVHTGPIAGAGRVVRGPARIALRETGAIAVDMESAATLAAAVRDTPDRPVTAVRVVVDAPGHELLRIGTVRGGISAFRVLRTLLPALLAWHRSLPLSRR